MISKRYKILLLITASLVTSGILIDDTQCMTTEQKMDSHLMNDVVTTTLDRRLDELIARNDPIQLQRFVEYVTNMVGPMIDDIENPQTLRENIRGYESVIIWATMSVIGFLIFRYGSQMYEFITDTASTVLQEGTNMMVNNINISPARIRTLFHLAIGNPATRQAAINLLNDAYAELLGNTSLAA